MNTIHNYFNSNRFGILLKREIYLNYKAFGLVTAITLLFYTLGTILSQFRVTANGNTFNTETLITSLSFMLIIWASISFNEIANTPGRQHYLSIPASSIEKLGTKWVLISLLIPICFILIYGLYSFLATWMVNLFGSNPIPYPHYDRVFIIKSLLGLIGFQSLFYAGSVTWPKYSLFKTLFFVFASSLVLMLITYLFAAIIFHEHFHAGSISFNEHDFNINVEFLENIPMLSKLLGFISFVVLMVIAYFKLQEKEL